MDKIGHNERNQTSGQNVKMNKIEKNEKFDKIENCTKMKLFC